MTQFSLKMENIVVVLLLLCALSSAEEALSQTNTHPDLSDRCAQLGDIRVQLAKNKLFIEQLQKDKEELEVTLKEQESQLEQTKEKLEEQDAKVKELEEQARQLEPMKEKLQEQDTKLKDLINQLQVGRVAFSASLLASGEATLGPFNTLTTLVFRYVVSNIGNAYSPNTGLFTAPVRGAYHFEFYIYAVLDGSHGSGALLVKNGEHVFASWERVASGGSTSANGATLLLEAGDVVFVRQFANTVIYDNKNRHSTFSGHLLFLM